MTTIRRPHILLIHADEHRADTLGCYGNPQVMTPHIDALAAQGCRYTESYCAYPVCTPSRYSLLTGLYVHQHLGRTNHSSIPQAMPTLPSVLRLQGYETAAVGKMHFTPTYLDVGFHHMILAEQDGDGRLDDDYHMYLQSLGMVDCVDVIDQRNEFRKCAPKQYWDCYGAIDSDLPYELHSTTWIGDQAVTRIREWTSDKPQMMMVGFIKPHHPFDPPKEYADQYPAQSMTPLPGWMEQTPPDDQVIPPYFPNEPDLSMDVYRNILSKYYATITHIDDQVGRLVCALRENNQYENTMIVYTSDHGDYMGYHHMILKSRRMYEPLMKVPLIIRYPGGNNRVDDRLVESIDVSATILDYLGMPPLPYSKGQTLLGDDRKSAVFAQNDRSTYMIRDARYKLVISDIAAHRCLYDLHADPLECVNLYADSAFTAIQEDLRQKIYHWLAFEAIAPTYLDEKAKALRAPTDHSPMMDFISKHVDYTVFD